MAWGPSADPRDPRGAPAGSGFVLVLGLRGRDSGVESLRPSAASSAVPGENQGGGASSASWQRSQPARAPERTGGEGGARGGRKEQQEARMRGPTRTLVSPRYGRPHCAWECGLEPQLQRSML
ncbi:unnamed protein product [Prorocentrum cordatum]|uniref:Uncharacterized protein n=1 Tax=Prorocentrum cordatum TaxID=2364126 RepID=A0ABN9X8Y4_9DINO|nr:unnamed protein product [Polarella glacialis]